MALTPAQIMALLPVLALASAAVVVLLGLAWPGGRRVAGSVAAVASFVALLLVPAASRHGAAEVPPLLATDGLYHLLTGLLASAALVCSLLARSYFRRGGVRRQEESGELFVLLLLGTVGAVVLSGSVHLGSVFLSLELLSVSLYGMVAYARERRDSLEAGLKYLILAGSSSAFLLLGVALLYAAGGSLDLGALVGSPEVTGEWAAFAAAGMALVLVALGFKLALAPFHLWTPDVYQGAPAPVTAFVASVSKAGVFAVLLRLHQLAGGEAGGLGAGLVVVAMASMILGNLLALLQEDLKRLLAYSSIAHLGYLLVPLLVGGELAVEGALFYLFAYLASILAAFGAVTALSGPDWEARSLESYRGLFWSRPGMAAVLTVALLSLAGIPLTAGFLGKLYVLAAGVGAARWTLALTLVATSAVGLFYYLRVVAAMFSAAPAGAGGGLPVDRRPGAVLVILTLLVLLLGVYPPWLIGLIRGMIGPG